MAVCSTPEEPPKFLKQILNFNLKNLNLAAKILNFARYKLTPWIFRIFSSTDIIGSIVRFRANLPGIMFDEQSIRSDYGAMAMTTTGVTGHGVPSSPEAAVRYSPPRSTSH